MKAIFTSLFLLFGLSLFAQSGALDASFGTGGKFISTDNQFAQSGAGVNAIALQSDGKIVMAGFSNKSIFSTSTFDFSVVRLNANGTPDAGFGTGGRVSIDFTKTGDLGSTSDYAYAVAIQPDGKIVIAGTVNLFYNTYIDSI